jgi:DNA-binding NtrC family response regulator
MDRATNRSKPRAVNSRPLNPRAKPHVLVVDDDKPMLYTFRAILEHFGYRASEATTPEEALSILGEGHVDVIISDLDLHSQMSGEQLLGEAARLQPHIGCMLLTGFALPETLDELDRRGVPVLFKPLEPTKLLSYIEELLQKKAA